jgi:hypothetical protein
VRQFIGGLLTRYGLGPTEIVDVNGEPAIHVGGEHPQLVAFGLRDGRVNHVYGVLNRTSSSTSGRNGWISEQAEIRI